MKAGALVLSVIVLVANAETDESMIRVSLLDTGNSTSVPHSTVKCVGSNAVMYNLGSCASCNETGACSTCDTGDFFLREGIDTFCGSWGNSSLGSLGASYSWECVAGSPVLNHFSGTECNGNLAKAQPIGGCWSGTIVDPSFCSDGNTGWTRCSCSNPNIQNNTFYGNGYERSAMRPCAVSGPDADESDSGHLICEGADSASAAFVRMDLTAKGLPSFVEANTEAFKTALGTDIARTLWIKPEFVKEIQTEEEENEPSLLASPKNETSEDSDAGADTVKIWFKIDSGSSVTLKPEQLAQSYGIILQTALLHEANFSALSKVMDGVAVTGTVTETGEAVNWQQLGLIGAIIYLVIVICCMALDKYNPATFYWNYFNPANPCCWIKWIRMAMKDKRVNLQQQTS